jgi:hypothetical protein
MKCKHTSEHDSAYGDGSEMMLQFPAVVEEFGRQKVLL